MSRQVSLVLCALIIGISSLGAQSLGPSQKTPIADGAVSSEEYSIKGVYNGMTLHVSLSQDGSILYLALEAPSRGWVSIGLGSLKMNGAFLVLGYDDAGKPAILEATGKGHGHKPNENKQLTSWAVLENGDMTTLEFSLPASTYTSGKTLQAIIAYGKKDDFTTRHTKYAKVEIPIAK